MENVDTWCKRNCVSDTVKEHLKAVDDTVTWEKGDGKEMKKKRGMGRKKKRGEEEGRRKRRRGEDMNDGEYYYY